MAEQVSQDTLMAEKPMVIAETSQQANVTADDKPLYCPGPSDYKRYKADASEELQWNEALLPFKEVKYKEEVRTCTKMMQKLKNLMSEQDISNPQDADRMKKEDLSKFIPIAVQLLQENPEVTKRGLYQIELPTWPEGVFFGDPNNATPDGAKPKHPDLKGMGKELIRRCLEKEEQVEESYNMFEEEFGKERMDQLLDTQQKNNAVKTALSQEINDRYEFAYTGNCKATLERLKKYENCKALLETLKKYDVSCDDDVPKLKVPALRELKPLFVKFLFWSDGKERGIYKLDRGDIGWPIGLFLGNPNPPKGKPSKETLVSSVMELFHRFKDKMESHQLDEEPPEDTAVEKGVPECATAVSDVLQRENAESRVVGLGVGFQACDEDLPRVADDVFSNIHGSPAKRPKLLCND